LTQIVHVSDFHLFAKGSWQALLAQFAQTGQLGRWLPNLYTVALPRIKAALPLAVARIANGQPSALVISGDITTSPKVQLSAINGEYYLYVDSLIGNLPAGSVLVPLLGNHDWDRPFGAGPRQTNFSGSHFGTNYQIHEERYEFFDALDPKIVFFVLDCSDTMVPATGEIKPSGFKLLSDGFIAGRNNLLGNLPDDEYERAFKIVLLHHSPVRQLTYDGLLTPWWYRRLELKNRNPLLDACKEDIDMFLFGHTHVPLPVADEGFIMADAGSAMAVPPHTSLPSCTIQVIRIEDSSSVTVETHSYSWSAGDFLPAGSRSFRKGAAAPQVRAKARWA
jgi:predicted phosphodiesterase